ncbi:ATP-binding protein [Actinomadura fulvescens]|uniref:Histidine kinase/HSP90-like ATPase domain-containing protein n=1 Tax=Actinomadura fulvescens TaxID=46160 RepID=A0ABN3QVK1_9ACTN
MISGLPTSRSSTPSSIRNVQPGGGITDQYIGRLVVSELVTNAFQHGDGQIIIRVFRNEQNDPVIEVWDQGPGVPAIQAATPDRLGGRGLLTIADTAVEWGTRPIAEGGKIVWARFAA